MAEIDLVTHLVHSHTTAFVMLHVVLIKKILFTTSVYNILFKPHTCIVCRIELNEFIHLYKIHTTK